MFFFSYLGALEACLTLTLLSSAGLLGLFFSQLPATLEFGDLMLL
jgi:hypothetical protein